MSEARIGDLEQQIELLVRDHVAALRRTAEAAVARAFSPARATDRRPATRRTNAPRRAPAELSALSERLYAAICAQPGAAMGTLAAELGATPRQLNRPALQLRRAGRLRSVGQRQAMRYFPMATKPQARS